jgi:hypothetical protein
MSSICTFHIISLLSLTSGPHSSASSSSYAPYVCTKGREEGPLGGAPARRAREGRRQGCSCTPPPSAARARPPRTPAELAIHNTVGEMPEPAGVGASGHPLGTGGSAGSHAKEGWSRLTASVRAAPCRATSSRCAGSVVGRRRAARPVEEKGALLGLGRLGVAVWVGNSPGCIRR